MAPPAHFLRMIIKSVGLDPDRDLSIEAVRDDRARLGLLRSGDAVAAIISAAVLPAEMQRVHTRTRRRMPLSSTIFTVWRFGSQRRRVLL